VPGSVAERASRCAPTACPPRTTTRSDGRRRERFPNDRRERVRAGPRATRLDVVRCMRLADVDHTPPFRALWVFGVFATKALAGTKAGVRLALTWRSCSTVGAAPPVTRTR
jgi:hypothetical protein